MGRGFRGVKDDLSEIGRHLLDVACFLAPLIAAASASTDSPPASPRQQQRRVVGGAINDLAEFGGGLRIGISRLSTAFKRTVGNSRDCSASASASLAGSGITEEVLMFVKDLAKCAESWTEFPVPVDDHFDMTRQQKDHIACVELLAPSLATLRITLCPHFMREQTFWKIYFALLHPKLNELESEFLSTQQIVEEMRMNLKKQLQNRLVSESQNLVPDSSSSVMKGMASDTEQRTILDDLEINMPNRMNSEPQNHVAESSSSMSDNAGEARQEACQAHVPPTSSNTRSLQYFDRWFETPVSFRETEASTATRSEISSKDYSYAAVEKRRSLPSVDPAGKDYYVPSSYKEYMELGKNPYSGDYSRDHDEAIQQLIGKASTDEESSEWNAVEDVSDFEIVERL